MVVIMPNPFSFRASVTVSIAWPKDGPCSVVVK